MWTCPFNLNQLEFVYFWYQHFVPVTRLFDKKNASSHTASCPKRTCCRSQGFVPLSVPSFNIPFALTKG